METLCVLWDRCRSFVFGDLCTCLWCSRVVHVVVILFYHARSRAAHYIGSKGFEHGFACKQIGFTRGYSDRDRGRSNTC